jgi:NAD(P)-dependent dehydrogenase (short-subunit alcohol dehydrogenase family)
MAAAYTQARISGLCLAARSNLDDAVAAVKAAADAASIPMPTILTIQVDVTDNASVEAAAAKLKTKFPEGLDIMVSNAGYLEKEKFIADTDPSEWSKSIDINFKGPYMVARSFIPLLLAKKDGLKILCNVTSIGAHVLLPGMSAYNIAKLALCRLTEYEDGEYGDKGLVAFSLHPGGVPTDMGFRLPKEKQAMLTDTHELVSDTTVWLTRERRDWLRGRYVSVQWDMKELEEHSDEIVKQDLLKAKLQVGAGFV